MSPDPQRSQYEGPLYEFCSNIQPRRRAAAGRTVTGSPDPYVPGHGTNAYRVTRYELDLDYKLASNRLNGRAVLHAEADRAASAIVLDLAGLRAVKISAQRQKGAEIQPAR